MLFFVLKLCDGRGTVVPDLIFFVEIIAHGTGVFDQIVQAVGAGCACRLALRDGPVQIQGAAVFEDILEIDVVKDIVDRFGNLRLKDGRIQVIRVGERCQNPALLGV